MGKLNNFFDANYFTTVPSVDLKAIIDGNDNFLISPVLEEVRKGKSNNPSNKGFDIVLDKEGKLKSLFKEISLKDCYKNDGYKFEVEQLMFLKKNPILCSSYFAWISSATNPATLHDIFRHSFNSIAFGAKMKNAGYPIQRDSLESKIRVKETQTLEKLDLSMGRNLLVTRSWLLKSRKKRLDDIRNDDFILTDYQLVTTALLYGCFRGKDIIIHSADRDIVDIKDNLYKSIIERYAVYELLSEKVKALPHTAKKIYSIYGREFEFHIQEIVDAVCCVLKKIDQDKEYIELIVFLFRSDFNKVFNYSMKIPSWLRDFILGYKKNLNCMSLDSEYDSVYNIKYMIEPDFIKKTVKYKVKSRDLTSKKVCLPFCHFKCNYPKMEKDNPSALGDFTIK